MNLALCLTGKQGHRYDGDSDTFVTHALRAEGFDASEDGTGRGTPLVPVLPFDERNITSKENRSRPEYGDECHTLPSDPPRIVAGFKRGQGTKARSDRFTRLDQTRTALLRQRERSQGRQRIKPGRTRRGDYNEPPSLPAMASALRLHGDYVTTIVGLRVAAQCGREDLRPEYARIADALLSGVQTMRCEHGDGI